MTFEQIFVLVLLAAVFFFFIKEIYPPEVTALGASAVLLATGIIRTEDFLGVFSSSAPITIAMMFILSAALERTGVLELIGVWDIRESFILDCFARRVWDWQTPDLDRDQDGRAYMLPKERLLLQPIVVWRVHCCPSSGASMPCRSTRVPCMYSVSHVHDPHRAAEILCRHEAGEEEGNTEQTGSAPAPNARGGRYAQYEP